VYVCLRFLELVRDNHPRSFLSKEEYEELRKQCCQQLQVDYKPEEEQDVLEISPNKPKQVRLCCLLQYILSMAKFSMRKR